MTETRRAVVGEDETLVRLDLVALLERAGYDAVEAAADGETLVALATATRPDLVVADVRMPGLDGIEAVRRILAVHAAPVVFVTALPHPDVVGRAVEAGAYAYLTKPFREADLLAAIAHAEARFAERAHARAEADVLLETLDRRRTVERAATAIARAEGITPDAALERIAEISRRSGRTTAAVAEAVLEATADG